MLYYKTPFKNLHKTIKMSNKIAIAIEMDARNIPNFEKNIPTLRSSVRKSLKNRNLPIGGINFSIDENGMVVVECYNGFANFKNQQLRNIRNIPKESALSWEQHAKKIYERLQNFSAFLPGVKSYFFYQEQAETVLEYLFQSVEGWIESQETSGDFISPIGELIANGGRDFSKRITEGWSCPWEDYCRFEEEYEDYCYDDGKVAGEEYWQRERERLRWASLINFDATIATERHEEFLIGIPHPFERIHPFTGLQYLPVHLKVSRIPRKEEEIFWTIFTSDDYHHVTSKTEPILPPAPKLVDTDPITRIMFEKQEFKQSVEEFKPPSPPHISWANWDEEVDAEEVIEEPKFKQVKRRSWKTPKKNKSQRMPPIPPAPKKNPWKKTIKKTRTLSPIHFPSL